jgi:hypothetical protein
MRRSALRRRRSTPRRSSRVRDVDFMRWVKTLGCMAYELGRETGHRCGGVVEADHGGRRGLGQKADDTTCIPLCTEHHRQRTDFSGAFKSWSKARMRGWLGACVLLTKALWRAQQGAAA